MTRFRFFLSPLPLVVIAVAAAAPAAAQESEMGGCKVYSGQSGFFEKRRQTSPDGKEESVSLMRISVRVDCDTSQFFADEAEVFHDRNRIVATGTVLYVSGGNRISADRMEFDTKTKLGTFYNASGVVTLGTQVDRSFFGTQEPDATFRGREVHKVGPDKYRIVDGSFTSCAQPTPRWEVSSGSITLNLDDYALLTNSIFRVKGVPVMYLPMFYYPIQEDGRATGFLMPTYGNSTIKGQMVTIPFFWAIGRSHDATFSYDWFSKTGRGIGGEYRYELGGGSQGNLQSYLLDEHETTGVNSAGEQTTFPAAKNYRLFGGMTQRLPLGLRARADADYFTDLNVQQRYQQDVYQATQRRRRFGGNISGSWNEYMLSATMERNDIFNGETSVNTIGSLPRVAFNRAERPIGGSKLYFGANSEYVTLLRSDESNGVVTRDQGLTRMDFNPYIRLPYNKWPYLGLTSSLSWRGTYWTESLQEGTQTQVPEGLFRSYFDVIGRVTGPVFNKIFNTPHSGYAEKFKHVIEPTFEVRRTTAIDEYDRIVKIESIDTTKSTTKLTYALNNRLYAKRGVSREILSVSVIQSYFTDSTAAALDPSYESSFNQVGASKFSPVRLGARTAPTDRIAGEFTTEWDHTVGAFRTFGTQATVNQNAFQGSFGWSQRRSIPELPGFTEAAATHYLNGSANVRGPGNRLGATYTFNYDMKRDTFLQQRYMFYYNAQCCGVGVEYQTFNFGTGVSNLRVPQDRRFNLSFTLAGIGTFSNFLGAFGGKTDR